MVDQEVLDTDAEHFDCETCPVGDALAGLDADNADAWRIYQQCGSRFIVEFDLMPMRLHALLQGREAEAVNDIMDRLSLMYDVLSPPPPPRTE